MTGRMLLAVGAALMLPTGAARAQFDMSWALQWQAQNWQHGQQAAGAAAQAYLMEMRRLRAMGYDGPPLPTGVTPQTMAEAHRGMQGAFDDYNRSWHGQSQRQSQVQHNYVMQGIRGCSLVQLPDGRRGYYCP